MYRKPVWLVVWLAAFLFSAACIESAAQAQQFFRLESYGPYNGVFLAGGNGLEKALPADDPIVAAATPWTLYCWFQTNEDLSGATLVAGAGVPIEEDSRYFGIQDHKLIFRMSKANSVTASSALSAAAWHFAVATFDGLHLRLYSDGVEVGTFEPAMGRVSPVLQMAPDELPWTEGKHFGGKIASFTLQRSVMSAADIQALYARPPNGALISFEEGSKSWPVQTRAQAGYRAPQDPWLMPRTAAPSSQPVARPAPAARTSLVTIASNQWRLEGGWKLTPAPKVESDGAAISQVGYKSADWWAATVPGTVLTTMIDRGVYPDSDYGLNNLAIPESLNKQDYWYRAEFATPKATDGRRFTLTFNGINYAAAVWVNGKRVGDIKGAFVRGSFDVTALLRAGRENAIAVRVSPPPHPGIPQEQSIKGGPGENGGLMVLDGPTFVATEGWDWIPAIRDRNTGLWQDVTLTATAALGMGDPQVVTVLPLPDTSSANIEIDVPITNFNSSAVQGTVIASFEGNTLTKRATMQPGESTVKFTSTEFAALDVQHPRLWWPNNYGKPELYRLKLEVRAGDRVSDVRELNFGIREITYELSLYDSAGHLRRVEIAPAVARKGNEQIVDVSHEGMRQIPHGWVATLVEGKESSAAVKQAGVIPEMTDLILRVNGVRIAARGGNWGMDDSRKRVSTERLEPYFRLHRDAHVNIIRNWVGQNTEESFYALADKYGILVWNDFWASTEDYNLEPEDPQLFLKNARDTILRFRNHPSIVMWCGRNEGVPQPIINEGLASLIQNLDGTRYYSPSSNRVNLRDSGPYSYKEPSTYYKINRGFSVELGVPSFSTLESFKASIPKQDQWPISDDWAYHDWHQQGNGEAEAFMRQMEREFGAATSLEDFDRKAQMLDYEEHRAIFEGFNAHLWTPNSGRLLWMTQPAWPSNMWQILSSDYDTQSSFYGVMKACEPVHVQLDLTNGDVQVVNTTTEAVSGLTLSASVYSLAGEVLQDHKQPIDAAANVMSPGFNLALAPLMAEHVVLLKLALSRADGSVVSDNLYWLSQDAASYRELNALAQGALRITAQGTKDKDEGRVRVHVENSGAAPVLQIKLTLENAGDGSRVLPAYLSDNYISLLPKEARDVEIAYPLEAASGEVKLGVRAWNLASSTTAVGK